MTELKKTRNDLPDVSSLGINASAKAVWEAIQAQPHFNRDSTVGKCRGVPGRYWSGAVNQIINNLWPALNDRYLTEKEEAENLKLALNRFLRHNQAVICTRDGGMVKPSMWFISRHWPELTVIPGNKEQEKADTGVVTDEAANAGPVKDVAVATPLDVFSLKRPEAPAPATEVRSEEEMTPTFQEPVMDAVETADESDEVVKHKCRLDTCDMEFEGLHHRATHEMKHGFRYNEDGTVTQFDPNAPTPDEEETQDLIIKFHERRGKDAEPLNQSQIVEGIRRATPKALSPTIKIVLQVMADEGWFEVINKVDGQRGRVRRFHYLGEPVRKAKKTAKTVAEAVEAKVDALTSRDDGGFIETAVESLASSMDAERRARYEGLFQDLMADLREIERLKAQIERMEKSHELVREELRRTIKERDAALAAAGNSEELERVTRERDELQGKLDTLKKALGSL